jgi:hypothetical protein
MLFVPLVLGTTAGVLAETSAYSVHSAAHGRHALRIIVLGTTAGVLAEASAYSVCP